MRPIRLACPLLLALGLAAPLLGCAVPAGLPQAALPGPRFEPAGGARLTLHLRLGGYGLLAAKTVESDLKSLKFTLIEHPADASPAGGLDLRPFGGPFSCNVEGAVARLSFDNVRANTEGAAYWIAVAAFDGPDGTGANITNATGDHAAAGRVTIAGEPGVFYLSTSGGDAAMPGSVRVAPGHYGLSSTASLGIALKLADAVN